MFVNSLANNQLSTRLSIIFTFDCYSMGETFAFS
jgi:hypothetical protein